MKLKSNVFRIVLHFYILHTLDHPENYDYHWYHHIQQHRLLAEESMHCEAVLNLHSV